MPYNSLNDFIKKLEAEGELKRIKEPVDPYLEITEITDRVSKVNGPALLFENTGTGFPLLINSMGSYKRMCMALGVDDLDEVGMQIEELIKKLSKPKEGILDKMKMLPQLGQISSWMPKVKKGRGGCQEIIMKDPDITKLPAMTCWPEDGGPFLTLPIIHTKDPENDIRNVGLYRMQVFGPDLTGMHWHKHKVSAGHFNKYKERGEKMPVAVALGGDPVYTYCATAPLPPNIDEYMLAGFIRKKKVELVQCLTQDVQVPADADIIIEGYIDPEEELILEGPFGDHTGYYSLADLYPKFHITAITHRKDPVYPSTIVGIPPQEDAWIGKATERIFLAPIKMTMLPEVVDMELPVEGVFHNLTIVKIKKEFSGHAQKVMNAMWGAGQMMFNKILVIVDGDVDIHDYLQVSRHISRHTDPENDFYFSQGPMDVLDHSCSAFAFGGKMCIDATKKYPEEKRSNSITGDETENIKVDKSSIMDQYPEITGINDQLLKEGISMVFIAVKKNHSGHIRELNEKLFKEKGLNKVKVILYVEHKVDINDLGHVVLRFTNNVDPKRDHFIIHAENEQGISHIGMDGTRKTKKYDNFQRPWPNLICSDEATIKKVDDKWNDYGIGEFIPSPSLQIREQLYEGGAVAAEEE